MNERVFLVLPYFIIIDIIKKNWVNKLIKPHFSAYNTVRFLK